MLRLSGESSGTYTDSEKNEFSFTRGLQDQDTATQYFCRRCIEGNGSGVVLLLKGRVRRGRVRIQV